MLEERFNENFTLTFNSQKGVIPEATIDGRSILINYIDLQWHADDDKYQGNRNYVKISFYFADEVKKVSSGDGSLLDENGELRQNNITIRECLYDTDTGEWIFPRNEI